MIATLHGTVQVVQEGALVVALGGLGLRVQVPRSVLEQAHVDGTSICTPSPRARERHRALRIWFAAELDIFLLLLGVNGVGPRTALAVLSTFSPETLSGAVSRGCRGIDSHSGIGRKTAERMVLDLRDRIGSADSASWGMPAMQQGDMDVINALTALGYSVSEARMLWLPSQMG